MSKKSSFRRHRPLITVYTVTPEAWNQVRAHLGWPATGEPVPYDVCQQLGKDSAAVHDGGLRVLLVLIAEAWQHSYPVPPHRILVQD